MSLHARGIEKHDVGDRTLYVAFDGIHEAALSISSIPNTHATAETDEAFQCWLDVLSPITGEGLIVPSVSPSPSPDVHLVA